MIENERNTWTVNQSLKIDCNQSFLIGLMQISVTTWGSIVNKWAK